MSVDEIIDELPFINGETDHFQNYGSEESQNSSSLIDAFHSYSCNTKFKNDPLSHHSSTEDVDGEEASVRQKNVTDDKGTPELIDENTHSSINSGRQVLTTIDQDLEDTNINEYLDGLIYGKTHNTNAARQNHTVIDKDIENFIEEITHNPNAVRQKRVTKDRSSRKLVDRKTYTSINAVGQFYTTIDKDIDDLVDEDTPTSDSSENDMIDDDDLEDFIDGDPPTNNSGENDMNDNVEFYKPRSPVHCEDLNTEPSQSDSNGILENTVASDNVNSVDEYCYEVIESANEKLILQDYNRNTKDIDDDTDNVTETPNIQTEIARADCNMESQKAQNCKSSSKNSGSSIKFKTQNKADEALDNIDTSDDDEDDLAENRLIIDEQAKDLDRPVKEKEQNNTKTPTKLPVGYQTLPHVIVKRIFGGNQTNSTSSVKPIPVGKQSKPCPTTQFLVLGNQSDAAISAKSLLSGKQTISIPTTQLLVIGNHANPTAATTRLLVLGDKTNTTAAITQPFLADDKTKATPTTQFLLVGNQNTNTTTTQPLTVGNQSNRSLITGNQTNPFPPSKLLVIDNQGKASNATQLLVLGNQSSSTSTAQSLVSGILSNTAATTTKNSIVGNKTTPTTKTQPSKVANQTNPTPTTKLLVLDKQPNSTPSSQTSLVGNKTNPTATTQSLAVGHRGYRVESQIRQESQTQQEKRIINILKPTGASKPSVVANQTRPIATTQPLEVGSQTKSTPTTEHLVVGNKTKPNATSKPSGVGNQMNGTKAVMVPLVEKKRDEVKMVCLVMNNQKQPRSVTCKTVLDGQQRNIPAGFKPVYVDIRKPNNHHRKSITTDQVILENPKGTPTQAKHGTIRKNVGKHHQGQRVSKTSEGGVRSNDNQTQNVQFFRVSPGNNVQRLESDPGPVNKVVEKQVTPKVINIQNVQCTQNVQFFRVSPGNKVQRLEGDPRPVRRVVEKRVTPKVIKQTQVLKQAKRSEVSIAAENNVTTPAFTNVVKIEDCEPVHVNSGASNAQDEHSMSCVEVKVEVSDHEYENSGNETNEDVINQVDEITDITDKDIIENEGKEVEEILTTAEKTFEMITDDLDDGIKGADDLDDVKDENDLIDVKEKDKVKHKTKTSDSKSLNDSSEVDKSDEAPEVKVLVEVENEVEEMDVDEGDSNNGSDDEKDDIPYTELSDSGEMTEVDLTCKRCWLCFDTVLDYNVHTLKCKIEFSCPICCKVFNEQDDLTSHMDQCAENLDVPDDVADDFEITALKQEVSETDLEISMCMVCSGMFVSREALQEHAKFCKRAEVCRRCRESFPDKESLRKHLCPERRVFSCGMCGKVFEKCHVLKAHMKIHTNERDFVCTVCSKTFLHKHQLKNHMGKHTEERAFKCPDCDLSYKYKSNLDKHRKTHLQRNERKQYLCRYCEHSFFSNDHRRRHEENNCRKNELSRTFHCQKCTASFKNKYTLARHIATVHDKGSRAKKMTSCEHCDQSFFVKKHLKQHLKIAHDIDESDDSELDEKDMELDNNDSSADDFDSEFDTDDDEKRHVSKLEVLMDNLKKKGEFECKDCDRVFRSAGNLERHLRLMHDQ